MLTPPEEFSFLCVARKTEDGFKNFFPHPVQLRLSGDPPYYLVRVSLNEEGPYWGWWTPNKGINHIYISKIGLAICFPYGLKVAEERDDGRVVRVAVSEVRCLSSEESNYKGDKQVHELIQRG